MTQRQDLASPVLSLEGLPKKAPAQPPRVELKDRGTKAMWRLLRPIAWDTVEQRMQSLRIQTTEQLPRLTTRHAEAPEALNTSWCGSLESSSPWFSGHRQKEPHHLIPTPRSPLYSDAVALSFVFNGAEICTDAFGYNLWGFRLERMKPVVQRGILLLDKNLCIPILPC